MSQWKKKQQQPKHVCDCSPLFRLLHRHDSYSAVVNNHNGYDMLVANIKLRVNFMLKKKRLYLDVILFSFVRFMFRTLELILRVYFENQSTFRKKPIDIDTDWIHFGYSISITICQFRLVRLICEYFTMRWNCSRKWRMSQWRKLMKKTDNKGIFMAIYLFFTKNTHRISLS